MSVNIITKTLWQNLVWKKPAQYLEKADLKIWNI